MYYGIFYGGKMKKITVLLLCVLAFFAFGATACGEKKDDKTLRVSEVTHSLFYAPFYTAINLGYFEDEGIKIELTNAGGSDAVMTALISKNADIGLMGPESVVYVRNNGMENAPIIFAQLTACDGSFLVGRDEKEASTFSWNNLKGKHVIAGRKAGMPAMTLQYILNKNGLRTGDELSANVDVKLDLSVAFNLTTATFVAGTADYCTMFEPTASQCELDKTGYIVTALGEAVSNIPYTCFVGTNSFLTKKNEKCEAFTRALIRGYNFILTASDSQIISALKPSFSTTSNQLIISAVKNYIKIGAYASSPVLTSESWTKMLEIIDNAGELKGQIAHSDAVNTKIATNALAS